MCMHISNEITETGIGENTMMTMNECLANTGKLVCHSRRHFIAILTNCTYVASDGETYIRIIRRDGNLYGADPYFLTLAVPSDLKSDLIYRI